jgi:hypothetical protein
MEMKLWFYKKILSFSKDSYEHEVWLNIFFRILFMFDDVCENHLHLNLNNIHIDRLSNWNFLLLNYLNVVYRSIVNDNKSKKVINFFNYKIFKYHKGLLFIISIIWYWELFVLERRSMENNKQRMKLKDRIILDGIDIHIL